MLGEYLWEHTLSDIFVLLFDRLLTGFVAAVGGTAVAYFREIGGF